jgi:hypothetical protein
MNHDAIKVRQIDVRSAFPSVRIFDCLSSALNPQILVVSLLCVAGLRLSQTGEIETAAPKDLLVNFLMDLRHIAIHGFSSGWSHWLSVLTRMLLLSFAGAAIARLSSERFCPGASSGLISTARRIVTCRISLAMACGLTIGLLILALMLLRTGQGITSMLTEENSSSAFLSAPSLLIGVIFLVASGVVLIAWLLSTTCIVVEGCDGSEALARSISYVLSRPLRTLTLLTFAVILSYGVSSLTTLLIDAAFRLHNARTEFGVSAVSRSALENLQTVVWQTVSVSTLFAGVSSVYLLLRYAEDGVSLTEIQR